MFEWLFLKLCVVFPKDCTFLIQSPFCLLSSAATRKAHLSSMECILFNFIVFMIPYIRDCQKYRKILENIFGFDGLPLLKGKQNTNYFWSCIIYRMGA